MNEWRLRGLYAITADVRDPARLTDQVSASLEGGAAAIQYRDKSDDEGRRDMEARALQALCRQYRRPLIVNDDVALAWRIGADGVHIGKDDADLERSRKVLGGDVLIGVSCYDSLERAEAAVAAGADYVAFGSVFPSPTKPDAVRANLELFRKARERLDVPIVAIGGITPDNGARVIQAGADLLAVISGVFGQPDPARAAHEFARLFPD